MLPENSSQSFFKAAPTVAINQAEQPAPETRSPADQSAQRARISKQYGQLPMRFEANQGQADAQVRFSARGNGYAILLTPDEAVIGLRRTSPARTGDNLNDAGVSTPSDQSAVVRLKLAGAQRNPRVTGVDELPGRSNYFIGNDPGKWQRNVSAYARVEYESVWPGIDLVWYGNQQQLEHDFVLAPGADPRQVRLQFSGAQDIRVNQAGALVLRAEDSEMQFLKPVAWQNLNGQQREVACEYQLNSAHEVSFRLGEYDRQQPLVIDPVLLYSTFIGGLNTKQGLGVAADKDGNAYVTGETFSTDFPTINPFQNKAADTSSDAYVLKLNASGTDLVYASYFGGTATDQATSLTVDKDSNVYIAGTTNSTTDFPITAGALQSTSRGFFDGFIIKLNPTGSALMYSTFLGGDNNEGLSSIAIDENGNAYVAGSTSSTNLAATGFQTSKSGSAAYKSTDSAGNWNAIRNGLSGTITQALAITPGNSNTIYAATVNGIFKSADGGSQWQLTGQGSPGTSLFSAQTIVIDPSNPMILYAAGSGGVLRSADGGNTYALKINGFSAPFISSLAIHPTTPTTLYAGTIFGAFKTIDSGDFWTPINNGLVPPFGGSASSVRRLVIHPTTPNTLYAATSRGMYKTTDGGTMWAAINNGLGTSGTGLDITTLAIDPTAPDTLYAGVGGFAGALYKTTDGGATWVAANNGLTLSGSTALLNVQALAINPVSTSTIYAGTVAGVYKSTNGGTNWNAVNAGLNNLNVLALAIDPTTPANVYAGTNGGTDGFAARINATGSALAWLTYLGGFESDQATSIAVDNDGNAYVAGPTSSGNFPTVSPLQAASGGGTDSFILKLNPSGATLLYSTYLGGNGLDQARDLALGPGNSVYLVGNTSSTNFPVLNPLRPALGGGSDAFVTRLNAAGSALEYSTWLGGNLNDQANSVAVDNNGNAFITGATSSTNFPTLDVTQPQIGGGQDAFVTRLSNSGALVYSTWLGGTANETGTAIAVDAVGNAYVVGTTSSQNFPTLNPLQTLRGPNDAFITKLATITAAPDARLVAEDFNGDGKPDLVQQSGSRLQVRLNNGSGSFTAGGSTDLSSFVTALATGDFNNDNKKDVVIGSFNDTFLTVDDGAGNLAAPVRIGNGASSLVVADFNKDGKSDLAATSNLRNNGGVNVLLNSGTNTFETIIYSAGFNPDALAAADFNQDTVLDIAATNRDGATVTLLSGTSSGVFQAAVINEFSGLNSASFTATDLNGDNRADVIGQGAITGIAFYQGKGNGQLNAPQTLSSQVGLNTTTETLTIADFNKDSRLDLAVTSENFSSPSTRNISILPGTAAGSFTQGMTTTLNKRPTSMVAADFNRDNNPDLATVNTETNDVSILPGNGRGGFGNAITVSVRLEPRSLVVADFNGDNFPDLAVANRNSATISVLLNNGAGSGFNSMLTGIGANPRQVIATDVNNDNKVDLIVPQNNTSLVTILLGNGNGTFSTPTVFDTGRLPFAVVAADFTGDGKVDVAMTRLLDGNSTDNRVQVYAGNGAGAFALAAEYFVPSVRDLFAADFNADGMMDLGASGFQSLSVLLSECLPSRPPALANVSAANYRGLVLAPETIAAAFGTNLSNATLNATTQPLPATLGGTTVKVKDSAGTERNAPLFFVSPGQVNYLVPASTARGLATITITNGNGVSSGGVIIIAATAPGLFTANSDGQGVPVAQILRIKPDGTEVYEPVAEFNAAQNRFVPREVDIGNYPFTFPNEQIFLVLFGTGLRGNSSLERVTARFSSQSSTSPSSLPPVLYAGAQGGFAGLDQINIKLYAPATGPAPLIPPRGENDVTILVDGKATNTVRVQFRVCRFPSPEDPDDK